MGLIDFIMIINATVGENALPGPPTGNVFQYDDDSLMTYDDDTYIEYDE